MEAMEEEFAWVEGFENPEEGYMFSRRFTAGMKKDFSTNIDHRDHKKEGLTKLIRTDGAYLYTLARVAPARGHRWRMKR